MNKESNEWNGFFMVEVLPSAETESMQRAEMRKRITRIAIDKEKEKAELLRRDDEWCIFL